MAAPMWLRPGSRLAAHGHLAPAVQWVRQSGLTADDQASYLREYEHVTLARILLAQHTADGSQGRLRDAVALLDRLLAAAHDGGRTGTVIEVLALLALAVQRAGDDAAAGAAPRTRRRRRVGQIRT